jgi:prophage DNA circulation protein
MFFKSKMSKENEKLRKENKDLQNAVKDSQNAVKDLQNAFKDSQNAVKDLQNAFKDSQNAVKELQEAVRYFKVLKEDYAESSLLSSDLFTVLINKDIFTDNNLEIIDVFRKEHAKCVEKMKQVMENEGINTKYYQKWLS